jgi:hypothetical protein
MYDLGLELTKESGRNLSDKEFGNVRTYIAQHEAISTVTGLKRLESVENP